MFPLLLPQVAQTHRRRGGPWATRADPCHHILPHRNSPTMSPILRDHSSREGGGPMPVSWLPGTIARGDGIPRLGDQREQQRWSRRSRRSVLSWRNRGTSGEQVASLV